MDENLLKDVPLSLSLSTSAKAVALHKEQPREPVLPQKFSGLGRLTSLTLGKARQPHLELASGSFSSNKSFASLQFLNY